MHFDDIQDIENNNQRHHSLQEGSGTHSSSFNEGFKLYINAAFNAQQDGSKSAWFSKYLKMHKPVLHQDISIPKIVHKSPSNASQLRRVQAMRKSNEKKARPTGLPLDSDSNLNFSSANPASPTSPVHSASFANPTKLSPLPIKPPTVNFIDSIPHIPDMFDEDTNREERQRVTSMVRLDPLERVLEKKFPEFHLQKVQPEMYSPTWKRNVLCEYCMFPVGGNCVQCMYCPVVAHFECAFANQNRNGNNYSALSEFEKYLADKPLVYDADLYELEWVCPECISDINDNHEHNSSLLRNRQVPFVLCASNTLILIVYSTWYQSLCVYALLICWC